MNTRTKAISGVLFVVAVIAAYAFFANQGGEKQVPASQSDDVAVSDTTEVGSPCPDFEPIDSSSLADGWTAYNRPEQCYSVAFPEGWGVKEVGKSVDVRRVEDLDTTSYFPGDDIATIGVVMIGLGGLTDAEQVEAAAALEEGEPYCTDIDMGDRRMHGCYVRGLSGNTFNIGYATDAHETDLDTIKKIQDTIRVW